MVKYISSSLLALNVWAVLVLGILASCNKKNDDTIIVATAANAQFAVEQIVDKFEN